MSKFAEYAPCQSRSQEPAPVLAIGPATEPDIPAMAALAAEREGGLPADHQARLREQLLHPEVHTLFAARLEDRIVGFGRVSYLNRAALPGGWYLSGLIVSPTCRRRGVGRALTVHRIRHLSGKAKELYYFANSRNLASVDLHTSIGFEEIQRGLDLPGVTFEGGVGVLYRLSLGY